MFHIDLKNKVKKFPLLFVLACIMILLCYVLICYFYKDNSNPEIGVFYPFQIIEYNRNEKPVIVCYVDGIFSIEYNAIPADAEGSSYLDTIKIIDTASDTLLHSIKSDTIRMPVRVLFAIMKSGRCIIDMTPNDQYPTYYESQISKMELLELTTQIKHYVNPQFHNHYLHQSSASDLDDILQINLDSINYNIAFCHVKSLSTYTESNLAYWQSINELILKYLPDKERTIKINTFFYYEFPIDTDSKK